MNILYINHYAGSPAHGMEYRPYHLAREWIRQGHNVTIIAANYSHLRHKNPAISDNNNYLTENIDGINYIWCKTPTYQGNGIKRVINIFTFLYRLTRLKRTINNFKPDLVIASSTYPFDMLVATKIAKRHHAKLIHEVHDLWPLTLIELGGMSRYHPFIYAMQLAENYAYRNADKVVSLLPKASQYMQEHGMAPHKFLYIPNGVVLSPAHDVGLLPKVHHQQIANLRKHCKFLIGYAGGMGESNALEYLIDAAALLSTAAATTNTVIATATPTPTALSIGFVLIGGGVLKSALIAKAKQLGLDNNVIFLEAVSKNQVPEFLSLMDGLYLGWHPLPIYRFGISPNKLFDYMLAAKPIIHAVTAGNDLVADANCGISVSAGDVQGIAAACLKLSVLPQAKREQLGANGLNYVVEHHDYAVLAAKILD